MYALFVDMIPNTRCRLNHLSLSACSILDQNPNIQKVDYASRVNVIDDMLYEHLLYVHMYKTG